MPIVDDNGTGTTGTILDKALWDAHMPLSTAPTTTGTQTALAIPAGTGPLVLYLNNATLLTILGIAAGVDGQVVTLVSKGAGQVDLAHLHASGTALGQLKLVATTGLTSLAAGSGVAVLQYDATVTQWRLVAHEQGALLTPTYAAGNFTGSAGTWTVDAGDVGTYAYKLAGRNLKVWFSLATTSVASAGAGLNIALPAGFASAAKTVIGPFFYNDNAGTTTVGTAQVDPSAAIIRLLKIGFASWATATNTTAVFGLVDIEVT